MAPTFVLLRNINKNCADWRIKVRCARKWLVPEFGRTPRSLEMVFIDKENIRIQATVKGHLIEKFNPLIKEHEIHCIKQFSVGGNKSSYPATNHQFRIFLFDRTYVGTTTDGSFPNNIYNFRSFSDVKNTAHSENAALFDVLGHVVGFDSTRMQSSRTLKGARNLEVLLEGQDLFGEQERCSQQISQNSSSSCHTIKEELENGICDVRTLHQISKSDEAERVWAVALITEVISEKNWSYTSCKKCLRKVVERGSKFFCEICHDYNNVDSRFKVHVNVVDGTQCLTLLLWDRECRELIGRTAKEIHERLSIETMQKDSNPKFKGKDIYKTTPVEIECLVGKQLFKVNIKEKNIKEGDSIFAMMRISEDADLIGRFKSTDYIITISDDTDTMNMNWKTDDQDSVSDNEVNSLVKTSCKRSHDEACTGQQINERPNNRPPNYVLSSKPKTTDILSTIAKIIVI